MDHSILRELISVSSSGELEESAPLSASDLISLLDNVRARSEEIRENVRKTVTTYNTEFLSVIRHSNQTLSNVQNVSEQLDTVLKFLGEHKVRDSGKPENRGFQLHGPGEISEAESAISEAESGSRTGALIGGENYVDVEICRLADEVKSLKNKIKEREEALVVVETISFLYNLLLATEKKFLTSDLIEAAKGMVVLREKLGLQDGTVKDFSHDGDEVTAFKLLQDAWADRHRKLLRLFEDLISQSIGVDKRRSELVVSPDIAIEGGEPGVETSAVQLSSIFTAMDVLGVLDEKLASLADDVFKLILSPILTHSQTVVSTRVLASGADLKKNVLKWSLGTQRAESVPEVLYPKIVQVIKFIGEHVFANHDERIGRFGRFVWPRLAEAIIDGCLKKAVPSKTSQLKDFENVAQLTACFEKDLASEGLIANFDQAKGDRLSIFAKDVEVHFASKKKRHVLSKARALLMQTEYNLSKSTWKTFDDDSLDEGLDKSKHLSPDPCAVSVLAQSLLRIVHEAIEGACLSTPTTALELYHASRDALLLFRAIIPLKVAAQPKLTQVTALFHNDCLFIAHEIVTFVFQYHEDLPPYLKQVFTFVDLVPLFRQMALEVLSTQIELVQSEIMTNLDQANGFAFTIDEAEFQIAEQALKKVFEAFASLGTHLRPVLAHSIYRKVIGGLINMVIERILYEILSINDIAAEETVQLQRLLRLVQESLPPFLAQSNVHDSEKDLPKEAVGNSVPAWGKLEFLTKLMDMSLISINQAWENGDLSACGFSPNEVKRLIRAIFSETTLREECLERIGRSS